MRRTLVFCRENAQLGNRLIVYAHMLAAARERDWELLNPTFEPYAELFVGTSPRPHGRSMWPVRLAWQAGKLLAPISLGCLARARARGVVEVDLQAAVLAAETNQARWLLIQGFRVRCPEWVARQSEYLRRFFMPIDKHRLPAEARVAELRRKAELIIGVHVRQGDYEQHLGGRFFYSFSEYAGFMRLVREQYAPRAVAFLVCTHVDLPREVWSDSTWAPGPGSVAADLHALSLCDAIMGPPSSFSAWAAFHGATPLHHIEDRADLCLLADFTLRAAPDVDF